MTRRLHHLGFTLALLLAGVGCGGTSVEGEGQEGGAAANAQAAVDTLLRACGEENGTVVHELLPDLSRPIIFSAPDVPTGCERLADLVPGPDPPPEELRTIFEEATVEEVQVDAGVGTATVRSPRGARSELELELSRGVWTISNPPLRPR